MHPDPLTELPELERKWMSAWITKDRAVCDDLLDAEFLLSSARGTLIRKPEWLAGAMSDCVVAPKFERIQRIADTIMIGTPARFK